MPCPDTARLKELLDGTLPEGQQAAVARHLETCEACQRTLEGLVAGKESWEAAARQLHPGQTSSEPALQQILQHMKAGNMDATQRGDGPSDSTSLDFLDPPDKLGQLGKLARYEILELIGRGGFGVVLKAFDPTLQRVVAIKVLAPQLATSPSARVRFTRESHAAAAVSHDHVVTIHAVEEANGLPYLVMPYVSGVSLEERLAGGGPLPLEKILRIGMQTAAGLAAAHAQGLVHRDIKPANILLENGVERVKITDFGLARTVDDASLTQSGVLAGTPQYMAPEQARGEAVDARADLFSLGSVLYALCTGRPPFRATTMMAVLKRVCDEPARPVREVNPEVPQWLCDIIDKLHAKDPADRFQSAKELADLLGQHLAYLQQPSVAPRPAAVTTPQAAQAAAREQLVAAAAQVTGPATGLWLTGLFNWLALFVVAVFVLLLSPTMRDELARVAPLVLVVLYVGSGLMILGGLLMRRLEGYWVAVASSIAAMLIGPGYLIGWPVGIWSLVVLSRREVRQAFRQKRQLRSASPPRPPAHQPTKTVIG
jgi:serine/threonine-protein kinase